MRMLQSLLFSLMLSSLPSASFSSAMGNDCCLFKLCLEFCCFSSLFKLDFLQKRQKTLFNATFDV